MTRNEVYSRVGAAPAAGGTSPDKRLLLDIIDTVREPLLLVDPDGRRFRLRFDCKNCRMEVWLPGKEEAKVGVK